MKKGKIGILLGIAVISFCCSTDSLLGLLLGIQTDNLTLLPVITVCKTLYILLGFYCIVQAVLVRNDRNL